jgi:hypothetical protein
MRNEDEAFDENGVLRDGKSFRVDVRLCDAMQRDVAKHAQSIKPQHLTDAYGDAGLSLNRPGFRQLAGGAPKTQAAWDALNHATEQAYELDRHFKQNAWRDAILDVSDDDEVYEAAQEAKASDCYQDYATEISQEWRRGNHE